ncbi:class E sortase [Streptomyces sp. CA-294286]|uniref:class E sortase n=1 Tax=Streptomyces sp. CA-294286 TaxID=3240070 RepID=UPI003D8D78CC
MSVRVWVRAFSEICITAGALLVLFVAYVVLWTGVRAADASGGRIDSLRDEWAQRASAPVGSTGAGSGTPAPSPAPVHREGKPFAVMHVPRFGKDWEWPVLEGTATRTLREGLGHYTGTARPGEAGNFAVAGHRRTYGDPFKDFPALRPGDAVVIDDGTTWFTYRVDSEPYRTVPGDVGVVDPVPRKAGYGGPGRYLTLTTCDPEWGSSHRLIVWAHLDATQPVSKGVPRALTG